MADIKWISFTHKFVHWTKHSITSIYGEDKFDIAKF